MKLLYITRKYPPMVGGMESLSYALSHEFAKEEDTTLIAWGKSQKFLPIIFPYFLFLSLFLIPRKGITHVLIGDALLSPIGVVLKFIFRIPTSCTVVGLDITFNFPGYQLIIPRCVSFLDKVFCISEATKKACTVRGIPFQKCTVIPCGIYPYTFSKQIRKQDLEKLLGQSLNDKKVLITVGRLVKRKGVYWFVSNVLPHLPKDTMYLIVGEGPEQENIKKAIQVRHLQNQVKLLGKVSNTTLKIIYSTADLFIMPNIRVKNTMEGFGIVAIEASSTGLPVIASNIEGIKASVVDGKNGFTAISEDAKNWIKVIKQSLSHNILSKSEVKDWTRRNYDWSVIGKKYIKEIDAL